MNHLNEENNLKLKGSEQKEKKNEKSRFIPNKFKKYGDKK